MNSGCTPFLSSLTGKPGSLTIEIRTQWIFLALLIPRKSKL
jgi:hypothetical protein